MTDNEIPALSVGEMTLLDLAQMLESACRIRGPD